MNNALRKQISIKDVAHRAGVDPSTVSRILSGSPELRAKEETIERVLRVASELNYRPDSRARSLRIKKTFALNMYIPSVGSPVFPEIIKGAEDACRKHGYVLFISDLDKRVIEERRYLDLLEEGRVDGLIMASTLIEEAIIEDLVKQNCRFILINRRSTLHVNYVAIDDAMGAMMAVKHLAQLGHRQIAYLSGPLLFDTSLRRFQGYRQGLHEQGLEYNPRLVEEADWLSYRGGRDSMAKILSRPKRPTAVFVSNLMSCVGAISAIHQAGMRIPEDISVIGFHDAPLAEVLVPPLTVVKMPLYEMGFRGADNLINIIEKNEARAPQLLAPIGIEQRSSTAPIIY